MLSVGPRILWISISYYSIVVKRYRPGVTNCSFGLCLREKVLEYAYINKVFYLNEKPYKEGK